MTYNVLIANGDIDTGENEPLKVWVTYSPAYFRPPGSKKQLWLPEAPEATAFRAEASDALSVAMPSLSSAIVSSAFVRAADRAASFLCSAMSFAWPSSRSAVSSAQLFAKSACKDLTQIYRRNRPPRVGGVR